MPPRVFKLVGIYRPRADGWGFGIPIFSDSNGQWVQRITDANDSNQAAESIVVGFAPSDVQRDGLIGLEHCLAATSKPAQTKHGASELVAMVDCPALFAFKGPDGRVFVGCRRDLTHIIRGLEGLLEQSPFLLQEAANFLRDDTLAARAKNLCADLIAQTKRRSTGLSIEAKALDILPFKKGEWVIDTNNPGRQGLFTGRMHKQGRFVLLEIEYGPGDRKFRPSDFLQPAAGGTLSESIGERLRRGKYGRLADLRRLITLEKLKGTLHEVIYSMEAAQIDFYPYQFKPVVKFINSPTDRLIIADEVGLGKTIESALIWTELQARKQARRLLIVCPTHILAKKWRDELREKFLVDARLADFDTLRYELDEVVRNGALNPFVLITTYSSLRPSRRELRHIDEPADDASELSDKTRFCQRLRNWEHDFNPFDLVVFDEAHHMRNAGTANFHLGESLARNAGAVLCVSATPVNNSNNDLHSLLRLIDADFFQAQATFGALLDANRPAVQLANALARIPIDVPLLQSASESLAQSPLVGESPLFKQLLSRFERLESFKVSDVAECQDIAEQLNVLGSYVTRTRRVQVKEHRPVRDPIVREVAFTSLEMKLYRAVVDLVRKRCAKDMRPFHVFQVVGLQMRAASSLPVLAAEMKSGRLGDIRDLMGENLDGDLLEDDDFSGFVEEAWSRSDLDQFLTYDFEANDSKFSELLALLTKGLPNEKIVIFSYYRGTLAYLARRLTAAGLQAAVIHGDIDFEDRAKIVDEFNSLTGPRILLSSEVGSEGIDLHHNCRALVNYDMPWNPMRVEQRIGRIDRVGQKKARLAIVHFKIAGTIEEKIYERLHIRLALFADSLGDLETVIGSVVRELTVELLSQELTPEMTDRRIQAAERVLETKLRDLQRLEESGESLVGLSDYIQKKIDEDRGRGRFVQASELEAYVANFFEDNFRGCYLAWDSPVAGCMNIRLSPEAQTSLAEFVGADQSLSARPFRQSEFSITFRREVHAALHYQDRRKTHFTNHLSPFIRWMTSHYTRRGHCFFNVSAIQLHDPALPRGEWAYRIERWFFKGMRDIEQLAYSVTPLDHPNGSAGLDPELAVQRLLVHGSDWDYPPIVTDQVVTAHTALKHQLEARFDDALQLFEAENQNAFQIRRQRVTSQFDRRLDQDRQRIETLRTSGRSGRIVSLAEARLKSGQRTRELRLSVLQQKAALDFDKVEVAAGIFRVVHETD